MPRPADPRKQQLWLQHIRRWQRSPLTVRDYCDRYSLSEASFHSWKRKLHERGVLNDAAPAECVSPRAETSANAPLFLPVNVSPLDTVARSIDLVSPDGWTVRIPAGFDAQTLLQLLAVLRERSC
jgi:hypothetical protein